MPIIYPKGYRCECGSKIHIITRDEKIHVDGYDLIILDVPVHVCSSDECTKFSPQMDVKEYCTIETLKKLDIIRVQFLESIRQGFVSNPHVVAFPKSALILHGYEERASK